MAAATDSVGSARDNHIPDDVQSKLRDDQFRILQERIEPKKRGRPSRLDPVAIDNKLLLQLQLLKDEGHSWLEIQDLFDTLCKVGDMPTRPVLSMVQTSVRHLKKIGTNTTTDFLLRKIDTARYWPFCEKFGITEEHLTQECQVQLPQQDHRLPVGLFLELASRKEEKGFSFEVLKMWLQSMSVEFQCVTASKLQKLLQKLKNDLKLVVKLKSDNPIKSSVEREFLLSPCFSSFDVKSSISTKASKSPKTKSQVKSRPAAEIEKKDELEGCRCNNVNLVGLLAENENKLLVQNAELAALQDVVQQQKNSIAELKKENAKQTAQIDSLQHNIRNLQASLTTCKQKLVEKRRECMEIKNTNQYQRLRRWAKNLKRHAENLKVRQELEKQLIDEKDQKRALQVYASQVNRKRRKVQEDLATANERIKFLQEEADNITHEAVPSSTRNEKGHYADHVVKCMIELVGECEVPVLRCNQVVQAVSMHFFGTDIPDKDLPSRTTRLRFADQGHSLACMQVAEAVCTQKFDLHTDGTSRSHKKFVGFQVTLEDEATLSLGFDLIAQEDAQSLLDLALSRLSELAQLYSPENAENQLKILLKNMIGVMTDRASTMKSFGRLLDDVKAGMIDPGPRLEFLHCNAHFLLGMSMSAEKACLAVSKEQGLNGTLGRDSLPAFRTFKQTEAEACRYIRMACSTLGPRGDEKNGCHASWDAFTAGNERPSQLTSFRANRFNNLFEAAAALTYHRDDIIQFLGSARPATNLKQQSVFADAKSDEIGTMVAALGLLFIYFTGPFWVFIGSDIHYLDQYTFIQPIHGYLKEMIHHPEMLLTDVPHELASFRIQDNKSPAVSATLRYAAEEADRPLLLQVLSALATHSVAVLERQLVDFLPGGKYGSAPTEEARKRMKHCRLTNLIGEACFADLDFTMFRNRHSTLHHHSTLNMLKRNKTISRFMDTKSVDEQKTLLQRARQLAPQDRQAHQDQERQVKQSLRQQMEAQKAERAAQEEKKLKARRELILQIENQGGPCKSKVDIVRLLKDKNSLTQKANALKVQLRYQRDILGISDARLKLSGLPLSAQCLHFAEYLADKHPTLVAEVQEEEWTAALRPKRLPRRQTEDTTSGEEDVNTNSEGEGEEIEEPQEDQSDFDFEFTAQGQHVAVFYDKTFYLGQVLEVHNPSSATITFMQQQKGKNIFRWTETEDIDTVDAVFVFDCDFEMMFRNRVWALPAKDWEGLQKKWATYCKKYVH